VKSEPEDTTSCCQKLAVKPQIAWAELRPPAQSAFSLFSSSVNL
jgi:hypothetical protein